MFYNSQQQNNPYPDLLSHFNTQRNICSQYVKIASKQLYSKEAQIISNANQLLQKLATKQKVKDLSEWDVFSTRDSMILDDDSSINLSNLSTQSRGKHIQRKSVRCIRNGKQLQNSLTQCLAEVQQQCTSKTFGVVRKAVEDFRKLKVKIYEYEKKQKVFRSQQKLIEELQQKTAILSRRIEDSQINLQKLKGQNSALKSSNSDLSEQLHKRESELNSEKKIKLFEQKIFHKSSTSIKSKPQSPRKESSFDILHDMMKEKQNLINLRFNEVKSIEQKIENELFSVKSNCQNCCTVLKKMKGLIIKYKQYLQRQGEAFEGLVDNFKTSIDYQQS